MSPPLLSSENYSRHRREGQPYTFNDVGRRGRNSFEDVKRFSPVQSNSQRRKDFSTVLGTRESVKNGSFIRRNKASNFNLNSIFKIKTKKETLLVAICSHMFVFTFMILLLRNIVTLSIISDTPHEDIHPSSNSFVESAISLQDANIRNLEPLSPIDYEQYTIRMNSWRRNEQLIMSLNHHSQCEGVAQIQVIWCDPDNEVPNEVVNHPSGKVVVEKHTENTLNERFNVLLPAPTLGILSIDDDVLRPCAAIDSGFFKWTHSPDQMVGFDGRIHKETETGWKYGELSLAKKTNIYSLSLTRYSFLHRDYLDMYMTSLPRPIFDMVTENLNCEDIAMTLFISSLTKGKPPLLADYWAVISQIKMFSESAISGTDEHKDIRDNCVNLFADLLGLKEGETKLQKAKLFHDSPYQYGAIPYHDSTDTITVPREKAFLETVKKWGQPDPSDFKKGDWFGEFKKLKYYAAKGAREQGLIEETIQFEQRWSNKYVRINTGGLVHLGEKWDLQPNGKVRKRKNGHLRTVIHIDPETERKKYAIYE